MFVITTFSIYKQLATHENLDRNWQDILSAINGSEAWKLYAVLLLMLANWSIEARKWQILLQHIYTISFWNAFKSVTSGITFTMLTPNRMGEFVGRVMYVPDGSRIRAAMLTIVSSAGQTIVTLFAGIIGLFMLRHHFGGFGQGSNHLSEIWVNAVFYGTMGIMVVGLLFFFNIGWLSRLIDKLPIFQRFAYFIAPLEEMKSWELVRILFLSALRFCVFGGQYYLLLQLFNVEMSVYNAVASIAVFYLAMAVIPTFAIAELGIRGQTSLAIFGIFSSNLLGILVTTAAIWLINIILPAIAGSIFVLGIKLFKKE